MAARTYTSFNLLFDNVVATGTRLSKQGKRRVTDAAPAEEAGFGTGNRLRQRQPRRFSLGLRSREFLPVPNIQDVLHQ